jgi:hypothetical protein
MFRLQNILFLTLKCAASLSVKSALQMLTQPCAPSTDMHDCRIPLQVRQRDTEKENRMECSGIPAAGDPSTGTNTSVC